MSLRQRQRLKGRDRPIELDYKEDSDEAADEELDGPPSSQPTFHILDDDSDEDSSLKPSTEELEHDSEVSVFTQQSLQPVKTKNQKKKKSHSKQESDSLDDDFDQLVLSLDNMNQSSVGAQQHRFFPWLEVSPHDLSMDAILLRRFGSQVIDHPQSRNLRRKYLRKFVFNQPQDDWIRPPHKIIALETADPPDIPSWLLHYYDMQSVWIRFQWSNEYQQLDRKYAQVQSSGDVNLLCHFLSQYPYHIEGFLQLVSQIASYSYIM